jgi:hypothetical protein
MQLLRNKPIVVKSGDREGQASDLTLLTFLPLLMMRFCRDVEVLVHIAATFVFALQVARPLNAAVIHFPETSRFLELLNILR